MSGDTMRDLIAEALDKARADYAEVRLEKVDASGVSYRGEKLDDIGSSRTVGGIARAVVNGGWGTATFNDLDSIGRRVAEACESARLAGKEKTCLAAVDPVVDESPAVMEKDFRAVPLSEKKALVEEYNDIVRGFHEKIETTNVAYNDRFRSVWFGNTEGTFLHDERPDVGVSLSATARDGDNVQRGFESQAGVSGFKVVEGLQEKARAAARRAVDLLSAPPVTGGRYTVIINPRLAGVFAHEAFGHLSESDFVYENERMKELMVMGKRLGPEILNIIDDGTVPGQRGTRPYDDEGVRTRKTHLIREGVLSGRLHSRETAAKMGEEPTGNARAIGHQFQPVVRMTNTCIEAGDSSFEEMLSDVKLGLYALDMVGGQTTMEMFTFSAAYGYMIRDGKVAEMVRDVVLTGNVFETLEHIEMVGSDLAWSTGGGGCGKGGQSPLPVGLGGPHVRIRDVVVGGRQG
jgi:TldD protein